MTRARWIVGAGIGAGALVVAGDALASYLAERLIVGVVAVLVLGGVLAIGLASLARAHRYVARELASLRTEPPGGALFQARREQLLALHRRGVAPDLDVLADATAAEEAGRGYTGKYLVATTVLIGLVGTFGGLMETLARVGPLLKVELGPGGAAGVLGLVAAPLAGLHVTFGTSVVAILVTLSLALIQGDVTLHHERMLALLQERTRHVLVPELWPAKESAAERTVQQLRELRGFVEEALTKGATASAGKIAAVVRVEVERLVEQVGAETRAASAAQTAALQSAGAATATSLRQTVEAATRELREAAAAAREALNAAATKAHESITAAAAKAHETISVAGAKSYETISVAGAQSHETIAAAATNARDTMSASAASSRASTVAASSAALEATTAAATVLREAVSVAAAASATALDQAAAAARELTAAAVESLAAASTKSSEALVAASTRSSDALAAASTKSSEALVAASTRSSEALAAASGKSSEAFAASTAAAVGALGDLRASLSGELETSSTALATAATALHGAVEALSPALAELAPQLGALTAEVALLAARAESPEQPNAVLDELVRLGEDVERLVASSPRPADLARETES